MQITLTILTRYPTQGASSRYRYYLYISKLLSQDISFEIDSFFDTSYLPNVYAHRKKSILSIIISYLKRWLVLVNSAENLIIEYEALPYMPHMIEKLFLKNKKYILNFDDNVWDNYKNKKFLQNKYDNLVQNAAGVIVANDFLFEKVVKLNQNIIKIPTVIDLNHYSKSHEKFEKFSIVWIGTPVTYRYILSFKLVFQELAKKFDYDLIIVAKKNLEPIDGVNIKFYDWSSKIEVELLQKAHLGIMPLDNDSFSLGKSSFKIIQYMASSLPIVASDIGENKNVMLDGQNGFLVNTHDEWVEKICLIYENKELQKKFSEVSSQRAYEFSLQKYGDIYIDFIKKHLKVSS